MKIRNRKNQRNGIFRPKAIPTPMTIVYGYAYLARFTVEEVSGGVHDVGGVR